MPHPRKKTVAAVRTTRSILSDALAIRILGATTSAMTKYPMATLPDKRAITHAAASDPGGGAAPRVQVGPAHPAAGFSRSS